VRAFDVASIEWTLDSQKKKKERIVHDSNMAMKREKIKYGNEKRKKYRVRKPMPSLIG